jgi:hypothetical protein
MFGISPLSASGLHNFTGTWLNQEAEFPRLEILMEAETIFIHAWGTCGDVICDWGKVKAEAYERVGKGRVGPTLTATFERDNRQVLLVLSTNGNQVEAKMVSMQLLDASTQHAIFQYEKEIESVPEGELTANKNQATGSIYGVAEGMAKTTCSIFHLTLYGPDNPNRVLGTRYFSRDRTYEFEGLEDGTYWLIVDSKGSTGIQAFPAYQEIQIKDGQPYIQNVNLE